MAHPQPACGADLGASNHVSGPDTTKPRRVCGHLSATARDLPEATPGPTVSALDRLIARIESGTATPEDVDGLPDGVVEYLHAVLTLSEMGALDEDWEVTPNDGFLVLNATQ